MGPKKLCTNNGPISLLDCKLRFFSTTVLLVWGEGGRRGVWVPPPLAEEPNMHRPASVATPCQSARTTRAQRAQPPSLSAPPPPPSSSVLLIAPCGTERCFAEVHEGHRAACSGLLRWSCAAPSPIAGASPPPRHTRRAVAVDTRRHTQRLRGCGGGDECACDAVLHHVFGGT